MCNRGSDPRHGLSGVAPVRYLFRRVVGLPLVGVL